ncbi:MAG: translation initiation factor IF-2 [Candidatus Nanoarchaeia archaeon]|nr:translation initiation factor IF-2 [Candidatus Nanoarchaeia archaeon]MDD5588252.1 translation initiation factor IF-2 [Candidatus Nanoarchaeia archaeon]
MIRQPIVVLVGHIDHGKSSILEKIKDISILKGEAGGITQAIGSYNIPLETIEKICGKLLQKSNLKIPGLLMIDTPGHAAFNNLRKRGGNLADLAILVIDINEGVMDQTKESIEILKQYKTPFIIALNKIDLLQGWHSYSGKTLMENIELQSDTTKGILEKRLYELVGDLYSLSFNAERFDRVSDYTTQIAMIPCSAKTSEGIPELFSVILGLAQKYLEKSLDIEVNGPGKGIILEVKEEKGLGTSMDTIIYDGTIKKSDQIIIGGLNGPIITKIKALFESDKKGKLKPINEASAAIGVKVIAQEAKDVFSGMPLHVIKNLEEDKKEITKEVNEVLLDVDDSGIIIKADSLGSLEALMGLLKAEGIKIKKASLGKINKRDISEVSADLDPLSRAILGFNVEMVEDAEAYLHELDSEKQVKVITNKIVYKIVDDLKIWQKEQRLLIEKKKLEGLTKIVKIKILPDSIFRQSNPVVVGVEVLAGKLVLDNVLFKDIKKLTYVKSMQLDKENIKELESGKQAAVSLPDITYNRQLKALDILYSFLTEEEFRKYKDLQKFLSKDEKDILKEIAEKQRKENPLWGV